MLRDATKKEQRNSTLSRGDGKHAVRDNAVAAAQKRIPCNRLGAVDRIYGNKGITLLLLDEALTIPFEVPRRYTRPCHTLAVIPPDSVAYEGELSQRDYTNLLTTGDYSSYVNRKPDSYY